TKENILHGSSTEEQRSQAAFCAKTLRAAGLLPVAGVGSVLTARCGDARTSPPWPRPKSLAAGPRGIFGHALSLRKQPFARRRKHLLDHIATRTAPKFDVSPEVIAKR